LATPENAPYSNGRPFDKQKTAPEQATQKPLKVWHCAIVPLFSYHRLKVGQACRHGISPNAEGALSA
jgi:hypothetical protein